MSPDGRCPLAEIRLNITVSENPRCLGIRINACMQSITLDGVCGKKS